MTTDFWNFFMCATESIQDLVLCVARERGDGREAPSPGSALDGASTWVGFVWSCGLIYPIRVLSDCVPRHLFLSSETRNCFSGKQGNSGKDTLRVFAKPQNRHITSAQLQRCSDLRGYPWRNCSERLLPQWNAFRVGGGKQKWKVVWEKDQRSYCPPAVLRPDPCVTAHECCAIEVWRPLGNPTPSALCQLLLRASICC